MASTIPVIVQGNSFSLAIPLQIYYINGDQMDLEDYTPDPTDEVSVQLKGSRRNYTYTPTIDGNVANIDLTGNELADNYGVVVSVVKANGQRLRSFRTDQFFIVESSDDLTVDDIIEGLEENVIYLNSSIFVAGEDGRGITLIVKTSTAGLVDTYTITYSDNTTSTFDVTNGAQGEAGATIASVEKTATVGKVDTYTITMTDGNTFNFEVTNGLDGVDLGLANIVDNLTTGGSTNVLSAEMGKVLGDTLSTNNVLMNIRGYTESQFNELVTLQDNTIYLIGMVVYSVANTLIHCTNSNQADSAQDGASYTATITPDGGYDLTSVTVLMGGVDITSTAYVGGVITIENVTGDISITATATSSLVPVMTGLGVWLDANDNQNDGTFHVDATTWVSKVSCGSLGNLTMNLAGDVAFVADKCARFSPSATTYASCVYGTNPFSAVGLGAVGTGDFTIEIVLNSQFTRFTNSGDSIYLIGVNSSPSQATNRTGRWRFGLYNQTNKRLDIWCNDGSGKFATSTYAPATGKQTLTAVRENGVITYYRNGVQVAQVTPTAQNLNAEADTAFCVGEQIKSVSYWNGLTGDVYDVKVYARALTAEEVAQNHSFNNIYYNLGL